MKTLKGIKAFLKEVKRTAAETGLSKFQKIIICFDIIYCRIRFHATCREYRIYQYHKYKNNYRKNFILYYHLRQKYANSIDADRSKYRRFQTIQIGYSRDILLLPQCGEESFLNFFAQHHKIVLKPDIGNGGEEVRIIEYSTEDAARTLFRSIDKDTVCEEFLQQHSVLNALNPHCLNTIRIVSLFTGNSFDILCATLKTNINPEIPTDNFHSGGIGASIHVPTGVVNSFARGYNHQTYIKHPITDYQIFGMVIPFWEEAKTLVKEAHEKIPETPLVGWDIAIAPYGPEIIEPNFAPGPYLMQLMDLVPKGEKLIQYMKWQKKHKVK